MCVRVKNDGRNFLDYQKIFVATYTKLVGTTIKQRIKKIVKFFVKPFWSKLDARIYLAECNIQHNLNQKSDELQKQMEALEMSNQLLKNEVYIIKKQLEKNKKKI